jgi:magnesium chelatase family protein
VLSKTLSAVVCGIDANIVEVEVDIPGIKTSEDHFHPVGLPDTAVRKSRDQVWAATRDPPVNCCSGGPNAALKLRGVHHKL